MSGVERNFEGWSIGEIERAAAEAERILRQRRPHSVMSLIERNDDDWQPRPGEMHPVDEAFYRLAIKERDYERVKVDRLEAQLAGAVASLAVIRDALDDLEHAPFRAQALADLPDIIRAALGGQ